MNEIVLLDKINKLYGDEVVVQVLFDIKSTIKAASLPHLSALRIREKHPFKYCWFMETPTSGAVFLDGQDISE